MFNLMHSHAVISSSRNHIRSVTHIFFDLKNVHSMIFLLIHLAQSLALSALVSAAFNVTEMGSFKYSRVHLKWEFG